MVRAVQGCRCCFLRPLQAANGIASRVKSSILFNFFLHSSLFYSYLAFWWPNVLNFTAFFSLLYSCHCKCQFYFWDRFLLYYTEEKEETCDVFIWPLIPPEGNDQSVKISGTIKVGYITIVWIYLYRNIFFMWCGDLFLLHLLLECKNSARDMINVLSLFLSNMGKYYYPWIRV